MAFRCCLVFLFFVFMLCLLAACLWFLGFFVVFRFFFVVSRCFFIDF